MYQMISSVDELKWFFEHAYLNHSHMNHIQWFLFQDIKN